MANEEHLAILKEGVDAWNRWRKEEGSIRSDLREAALDAADLYGADLRGANLQEASLIKADLSTALGFTQAQLDTACSNGGTELPRGLIIKPCPE